MIRNLTVPLNLLQNPDDISHNVLPCELFWHHWQMKLTVKIEWQQKQLLVLTKMPSSGNQMWVKCETCFAEWVNQPGVRTSKRGRGSKALKAYIIWALVLYWKILFTEQIHSYSKAFLFNKKIFSYKSPSYASTPCIHPSFLIPA